MVVCGNRLFPDILIHFPQSHARRAVLRYVPLREREMHPVAYVRIVVSPAESRSKKGELV